jgi:hypothetical protein
MIPRSLVVFLCLSLGACATRAPSDRVVLPAAPPPGEPSDVIGLSVDAMRAAFGAPAFTRKDGGTQMWRYDGSACKAFFFFFPEDNGLAVRHVETLPHGANIAADATCLDALRLKPVAPPPVS